MNEDYRVLSSSQRFEIFKRDSFTCQYCGRKAPDVVLVVDHVDPWSAGGRNTTFYLVTACYDCNMGKSKRQLKDDTISEKQRLFLLKMEATITDLRDKLSCSVR